MTYIEELREVIHKLHGAEATHIESVQVREEFAGRTIWDGCVEVFALHGHPTARRIYAWAHDTDDPDKPRRHVTVLHVGKVTSAVQAVRAAIIEEFRSGEPTAEEA